MRERRSIYDARAGFFQGAGAFAERRARRKNVVYDNVARFRIDSFFKFFRDTKSLADVDSPRCRTKVRLRSGIARAHEQIFDAGTRNVFCESFGKNPALIVAALVFAHCEKRDGNEFERAYSAAAMKK